MSPSAAKEESIHNSPEQPAITHPPDNGVVGIGVVEGANADPVGQGANSQLGAIRPTAVPSGHIFASSVHATGIRVSDLCLT